jgi:iron-sulfur cluster repair protein YtfE (RIC family)
MPDDHRLDPTMSIDDTLCLYPDSRPALNAAGIDTCCGGAEPLGAAALTAGADLDALIDRILELSAGGGTR